VLRRRRRHPQLEGILARTRLSGGARLLLSAAVAVVGNLLPAALLFYFVHRYGVDVPWWDEWDIFLIPVQLFDNGRLTVSALFAQYNDHRVFFPRLITLANAMLFHWNRTAEMYVTVVLLIVSTWLFYLWTRAYWTHSLTPLLFLPAAWTLLTFRQWENQLAGMGTVFTLLETGIVAAFLLLNRARGADKAALGAAAAAFVGTFSSGGGIFIWPVGLAQLMLQRWRGLPEERPRSPAFLVWIGSAILSLWWFFSGYRLQKVPWPTGIGYALRHPVEAAQFVAGMFGSPLTDRALLAQWLGVVLLACGAWAVFRLVRTHASPADVAPWLAFFAFVLLTAAVGCDRRLGMGATQALASRYCGLTSLAIAGIYVLMTKLVFNERKRSDLLVWAGMAALLLLGSLVSFVAWRKEPPGWREQAALRVYSVRYADVLSDKVVATTYPNPAVVRQRAPFLQAHGYSLFHEAAPAGLPARYEGGSGGCSIDAMNGRTGPLIDVSRSADSAGVDVAGWARDQAGQQPSRVFVSIDGRTDIPALVDPYGKSGFVGYLRTSLFDVGEHKLQLKIVSHDGLRYWTCGSTRMRVTQ
jgi:hypothetical protein